MDRHPLGKSVTLVGVLSGLITNHNNLSNTLSKHLMRDHLWRQINLVGLPTGHGDSVIEQDLEGNIGLRGFGRPNRQRSRVRKCAIPHILKDVFRRDEVGFSYPVSPLAAHMHFINRPAGKHRHAMTPNSRINPTAFRGLGRYVVRAARTKVGWTS